MRIPVATLWFLLISVGLVAAEANEQEAKIDTLIQEPSQADDIPEAVVRWLEARDFLIPLGFYSGHPKQKERFSNTVRGSFTGVHQVDYAILTVERNAIDDSCSLWVFPSGDTLAPMLLGPYKIDFYAGTNWWPQYGKNSPLGYAWYLRPMSQEWLASLKEYAINQEEFPEITHAGIRLGVVDKGGGWHYYYNGEAWMNLDGAD